MNDITRTAVMHQGAPQLWRRLSIGACSGAIAISVLALVGWTFGIERLTNWVPDVVPFKVSGSIVIIFIGAALLRLATRHHPHQSDRIWLYGASVISFAAGLYGVIPNTLDRLEHGSFTLPAAAAHVIAFDPLRIPIASGAGFLLLAVALGLLPTDWNTSRSRVSILSLACAANALLTLLGYGYGVRFYFSEQIYVPMPLPTAVAFLLLSFVIIVVQPAGGILSAILSDTTTGQIARRLLPAAVLIPAITGTAHVFITNNTVFDHSFVRALESLLTIILLSALLLYTTISSASRDAKMAAYREQRDREAENRRLLWELSQDMLAVANREGRFIEVNPAWTRTLGWTPDEMLSRSLLDFVHPDDRDATARERGGVLDGKGSTPYFQNRYLCKDGTYRTLQWHAALNPETDEVFAVARDVTAIVAANNRMRELNRDLEMRVKMRTLELETANKELESFSYAVSHDLRAPLRAIEGFSRMVVERFADELPEEGKHFLSRVRAGSTRMGEIIDGLLTLSRLSRGDLRLDEIDLSAIAREIVEDLRAADPEREVDISIEPDMHVIGDHRLLQSLMLNLISNAWKFTGGKDTPQIEVGSRDGEVTEFYVRDNGAGFDEKHAGKLFTPFQRLHTIEEFDGTGLGLATVRRIVNRHGGTVRAEGAKGEGATFSFSLPASDDDRVAHDANREHNRGPGRIIEEAATIDDRQEQLL